MGFPIFLRFLQQLFRREHGTTFWERAPWYWLVFFMCEQGLCQALFAALSLRTVVLENYGKFF